jgi:hypothetical protein
VDSTRRTVDSTCPDSRDSISHHQDVSSFENHHHFITRSTSTRHWQNIWYMKSKESVVEMSSRPLACSGQADDTTVIVQIAVTTQNTM